MPRNRLRTLLIGFVLGMTVGWFILAYVLLFFIVPASLPGR